MITGFALADFHNASARISSFTTTSARLLIAAFSNLKPFPWLLAGIDGACLAWAVVHPGTVVGAITVAMTVVAPAVLAVREITLGWYSQADVVAIIPIVNDTILAGPG